MKDKIERRYRKWKPSEEKKMLKLWQDGMTFPEIGVILQRPSVGVYQRWCILNRRRKYKRNSNINKPLVQYQEWTTNEENKLKQLVSEGKDNYTIGKLMNRSQWSIKNKVKRLSLRLDNEQVVHVKRGRGRPRKYSKEVTQETNREFIDLLQEIINLHKEKKLSKITLDKLSYGYICAIKELMENELKIE